MNLLRFKSPALIELVTPSAEPGVFATPLTRDIKVVNAFAFASAAEEDSAYQIFYTAQGNRTDLSPKVPLVAGKTTYLEELKVDALVLRTGWVLGVEVFGKSQANIYMWAIPLPTK